MTTNINKILKAYYDIDQDSPWMADGGNALWDMYFDILEAHELEYLKLSRAALGIARLKRYFIDPALILPCCAEDMTGKVCGADDENIFNSIAGGGFVCRTKEEYFKTMELILNCKPSEEAAKTALRTVFSRHDNYEKDHKPYNAKRCCRKHLFKIFPYLGNEIADNTGSFMMCIDIILSDHKASAINALALHAHGAEKTYFTIKYLDIPYHYIRLTPYDRDPRASGRFNCSVFDPEKAENVEMAAAEAEWWDRAYDEIDKASDMMGLDFFGENVYIDRGAVKFIAGNAVNILNDEHNCRLVKEFMPIHAIDKRTLNEIWFRDFFRSDEQLKKLYSDKKEELKEFFFIKQEEISNSVADKAYSDKMGILEPAGSDLRALFLTYLPASEDEDRTIMPEVRIKELCSLLKKEKVYIENPEARRIIRDARSYRLPERELIKWTCEYFGTDC